MIRNLKAWLHRADREIPFPVAGALVLITFIGAVILVVLDWQTVGLPPKGAPGRYDWATARYYKEYRLKLEAQKDRWFKEHPQYEKYRGLPAEEMFLRSQQDEREKREREEAKRKQAERKAAQGAGR